MQVDDTGQALPVQGLEAATDQPSREQAEVAAAGEAEAEGDAEE